MTCRVLQVLIAAVITTSAGAQMQFDASPSSKRHLPADGDRTHAIVMGDLDGDGDRDLVAGNDGPNRLYRNDGTGAYTDVTALQLPADNDTTRAAAICDVDGDGDADLVFANSGLFSRQNRLYLNDGTGRFTDATATHMPALADDDRAVATGDIDGDGDIDLVFANGGHNRLYFNDGTGRFLPGGARLPTVNVPSSGTAMADIDADGDLDLVFANAGQNRLYINDGTGRFTDVTTARLPPDNDASTSVAMADIDGDGDSDLVFGNVLQNRLYLNDGTGRFSDATTVRFPADSDTTTTVGFADVDNDGDVDLVFGNQGQDRMYLNDGTGTFADATGTRMPADDAITTAVALADADGDGDADFAFGSLWSSNRLYLNDGSGTAITTSRLRIPGSSQWTQAVALGDVDGDADLDLVFGNGSPFAPTGEQDRLYCNDGTGIFADLTARSMPPDSDVTWAAALCDVDGDGDLDMVSATSGQDRLYLNDGRGTFTDATAALLPTDSGTTLSLAAADVDGDGDADLLLGTAGQTKLYGNDGTGRYLDLTPSRMPPDSGPTRSLAVGDVDADGDLDLVLGISGTAGLQNRLYLNDGTGAFVDATGGRMPTRNDFTQALALGDLDGDGDLDLILGNGGSSGQPNGLYRNDGTGTFTDASLAGLPQDRRSTRGVALFDLDGDGDLDLAFGNGLAILRGEQNQLLVNDGTGTFADATGSRLPPDMASTEALAFGDLDGDGDLDLVAANAISLASSGQNLLYTNLLRQLDSPFLVRTGRRYRLDVYARYGPPRLVDVALPYASTAAAWLPLPPVGILGIDPAFAIPLPPLVIPRSAGVGSISCAIPNSAGLVGVPIHAQALLLQWPATVLLTNAVADRIAR